MLLAATLATASVAYAPPQTLRWTATIQPGIQVITEVSPDFPLSFRAVKFRYPAEGVRLESRLAWDQVYSRTGFVSRENTRDMVARTGALIGINADFFGNDGDPLGAMLSEGELVSEPYFPRTAVAWGPEGGLRFDSPAFSASIEPVGAPRIRIDGFNRSVRSGEIVLFTRKGGNASSKLRCTAFLFEAKQPVPLNATFSLRLKTTVPGVTDIPVALDEVILMVSPERIAEVSASLFAGLEYDFKTRLTGQIDWSTMKEAIGGGPRLVVDGVARVTRDYERFDPSYNNRHPRSAVGYTRNGEVVLLAVDGRMESSKGLTLDELANLMVKLGCVDAMNLDGGGSSTLVLGGAVLNRPSDGGLRAVANSLLVYAPKPVEPVTGHAVIVKPGTIRPGDRTTLEMACAAGTIPPEEVVWAGNGAAGWVGGDGAFRATAPGKVTVRAYARGAWASADVIVTSP